MEGGARGGAQNERVVLPSVRGAVGGNRNSNRAAAAAGGGGGGREGAAAERGAAAASVSDLSSSNGGNGNANSVRGGSGSGGGGERQGLNSSVSSQSSPRKTRKGKVKAKVKAVAHIVSRHKHLQEIDSMFARVQSEQFIDDVIDVKISRVVSDAANYRRTRGAAARGRTRPVDTPFGAAGNSRSVSSASSTSSLHGHATPAPAPASYPSRSRSASLPSVSSSVSRTDLRTGAAASVKTPTAMMDTEKQSRSDLLQMIQAQMDGENRARFTQEVVDTTKMKLQAIENEKYLAAKKGATSWKKHTVEGRLLKEVGPFPLPTKAAAVPVVVDLFTGKDPFEAAFLFCMAVLRLVTLKTGRGSGKERSNSCKMLTAALSSANLVNGHDPQGHNDSVIRPTTLRLLETVPHDLIQSYFVGVNPKIPHPLSLYQIDADNLVVQFKIGPETIPNIEGANHVVSVVCNGAYPHASGTRSLQMRCEDGSWKVEKFIDFLKPVVVAFTSGVGASVKEMAREKAYRAAVGLQRAESDAEESPEPFPQATARHGTMQPRARASRRVNMVQSQLEAVETVLMHDRPDSKRICECFTLRKALNPVGPYDERFDFKLDEIGGEQFQQQSHQDSTDQLRQEYKTLPPPPRDIHSFLATCERQHVPTGVYKYWPRGPAGKSAAIHPEKSWIFQPADVGCGVLLKFRMKGAEFVWDKPSGCLIIPYDAGVPITQQRNAANDGADNVAPTATSGDGADEFVILQGVLTGMRKAVQLDDSESSNGDRKKSRAIKRMRSVARSVKTLQAMELSARYNDETKSTGNYESGWEVEVEISVGTCPESNCLDHFGIGKKSVVPGKSVEQNRVLMYDGPFGSGKPFAGRKTGKFLSPPHFISPATSPKPAYVCKIGTKIVVKERGLLYGYCATIVGHSGMRTLAEIRDSKGPFLGANRPFVIEFDNTGADSGDRTLNHFVHKIGNHSVTESWDDYSSGDNLIVIDGTLRWVEVTIKHYIKFARYVLHRKIPVGIDGNDVMEMDLNGANHFCPLLSLKTYEDEVKLYLLRLHKENAKLVDNITLAPMDAEGMLIGLKLVHSDIFRPQRGGLGGVDNVRSLCNAIAEPDDTHRRCGCHCTHPSIIRGGSGSGKTWACKQMVYVLSHVDPDDEVAQVSLSYRYIPLLLDVHKLARLMKLEHEETCAPSDVIELYCESETGGEDIYNMLMDAYASKRLFVIIDGMDEVPHLTLLIQRLIFDVLIPGQHKVVACGKAIGVDSELYRVGFAIYELQPLTERQQRVACSALLDGDAAEFTTHMFEYLRNRGDQDTMIEPLQGTPGLKELEELGSFDRPELVIKWLKQDVTVAKKQLDWDDYSGAAEAQALATKAGSGQTIVNGESVIDLRQVVVNKIDSTATKKYTLGGDVYSDTDDDDQPPALVVMAVVSNVEELMEGVTLAKAALATALKTVAKQHHMPVFHGRGSQRPEGSAAVILHHIDPITRIDAIAQERYSTEVASGLREGPAIAWTTDAVRATVLCNSPSKMISVVSQLQKMPEIAVVRAVNYFSDLDPTHYRRLQLVIKIDVGDGTRHFIEVEMQLVHIYENAPNTKPCAYFQRMFGSEIAAGSALYGEVNVWTWITSRMKQWVAMMQTPIVLSLMIVNFREYNYHALKFDQVPINNAQVYTEATAAIVNRGIAASVARLHGIINSSDADDVDVGEDTDKSVTFGNGGSNTRKGPLRQSSVFKAKSFMSSNPGTYHFPHSDGDCYDDEDDDDETRNYIEDGGKHPKRKQSIMMAKVQAKKKEVAERKNRRNLMPERPTNVEITPEEAEVLLNDRPDAGRIIHALGVIGHANHLHRGTVRSVFTLKGSDHHFEEAEPLDTLKWFVKVGGDPQHLPGFVIARDVDPDADHSDLVGDAIWMNQIYECVHSSIQEHLCSEHLSRTLHKGTHVKSALRGEGGLSSFVNGARHYTLFNVAGGGLARGLFGHAGRAYLQNVGLNKHGLRNLFSGSWLQGLCVLDLSHNGLSADSGPLVEGAIQTCLTCLTTLLIVGNNFTFSTRVALFQWACKDHDRKIELDGGNEKLDAALRASDKDASVVHLDLSSCKLRETDCSWLTKVLADNNTVRSAHLWSNQLGPECGTALANVLQGNTSLNELILYNNDIAGHGAVAIAKAVARNKSLVKLDLERNMLGEDAGVHLAQSLMKNKTLSVLHLQRTMLGEMTGMMLSEVLSTPSCNISDLKLDWNCLGKDSVAALGSALNLNRGLRHLSLRAVGMDDHAAAAIARALAVNTSLVTLQLGSNGLGEQAGLAFAGTLVVNATLTKLVLANNNLGDTAGQAIAKAVGMKQFPRQVNVESNGFSKKTKSDLAKTKKKYPACKLRF